MLDGNAIKEELSRAYVHAVAATLGFACEDWDIDRDSVDVTVKAAGLICAGSTVGSPKLDLQLKASGRDVGPGDSFPFVLTAKNYRDLSQPSESQRLLVVLLMPSDLGDACHWTPEVLCLRRCAYWHNLLGAPASNNETSVTVTVSKRNVFSPGALQQMMVMRSRQEVIGDALPDG
jgi:hypothetical protein